MQAQELPQMFFFDLQIIITIVLRSYGTERNLDNLSSTATYYSG